MISIKKMSATSSSSCSFPILHVERLHPDAQLPSRGTPESAGLDVHTPAPFSIGPGERLCVPLGIRIHLPVGTWGHLLPRSGLALKKGIHVGAGVIDSDYRGELMALLFNLSDVPAHFAAGDRVAQLVVQSYQVITPFWVTGIVDDDEDGAHRRGTGGFGSTGN